MHILRRVSRRQFVKATAAATLAGPTIITSLARGNFRAANDRIQLGFIGIGVMGRGHLGRFLGFDDVQVVAVCDAVDQRRDHAQKMVEDRYADRKGKGEFSGCAAFTDPRDLIEKGAVDAVLIATPDHWHAVAAIAAVRAGKDVYCEKPLTHELAEGQKLVEAVREHGVVFQTGSQQRSEFGGLFRQAVEFVRNDRLGRIHTVRVGVGGPPVPCDLPAEEVPDGTHWDLWLGPASERPYNEILCPKGIHNHFPAWRNYREYGGGGLADMGAHHFDIAQWALDTDRSGPVKVEPPEGGANSGLKFTYASGIVMYHGGPSGCTFEGEKGTLYVDRGTIKSDPAEILETPLGDDAVRVYHSDDHSRNWIECIRSRKGPICDAEIGHRSASICHLANIGYRLRRPLNWDSKAERFDDEEANALLSREPRKPWTL